MALRKFRSQTGRTVGRARCSGSAGSESSRTEFAHKCSRGVSQDRVCSQSVLAESSRTDIAHKCSSGVFQNRVCSQSVLAESSRTGFAHRVFLRSRPEQSLLTSVLAESARTEFAHQNVLAGLSRTELARQSVLAEFAHAEASKEGLRTKIPRTGVQRALNVFKARFRDNCLLYRQGLLTKVPRRFQTKLPCRRSRPSGVTRWQESLTLKACHWTSLVRHCSKANPTSDQEDVL
jgi:hypothetical protein